MLQIRKMTGADAKTVLPMVYGFYRSDAVDHAVPEETLNRTFQAAATDGSLLEGFVLEDETGAVGFAYLSPYYACEVGGVNRKPREKDTARNFSAGWRKPIRRCAGSVWK